MPGLWNRRRLLNYYSAPLTLNVQCIVRGNIKTGDQFSIQFRFQLKYILHLSTCNKSNFKGRNSALCGIDFTNKRKRVYQSLAKIEWHIIGGFVCSFFFNLKL